MSSFWNILLNEKISQMIIFNWFFLVCRLNAVMLQIMSYWIDKFASGLVTELIYVNSISYLVAMFCYVLSLWNLKIFFRFYFEITKIFTWGLVLEMKSDLILRIVKWDKLPNNFWCCCSIVLGSRCVAPFFCRCLYRRWCLVITHLRLQVVL